MPTHPRRHDVLVIGGGSAGYAAARTARDAGADVGIVDPGPLGGLCILRGCMPSKAILRSAEIMALLRRAKEFGVAAADAKADLAAILDRKNRLVREFASDRIAALRDARFTFYERPASFRTPHEVSVGEEVLTADAFVIATGSVPRDVAVPGLHEVGYVTSDGIFELHEQPSSLLVLGGGPVAVELAQFFSRIGTAVTLIQRSSHLLSHLDEQLGAALEVALRGEGMRIFTGALLQRFTRDGALRTAHFLHRGNEHVASGDLILQAFGRRPNIDGLRLEAAGVRVEDGAVVVDAEMRTSQPHIFAVGDVNDLYDVVHIAVQQGEVAGHNAARPHGPARRVDERLKTEVIFTDPQVATVGLGERECRAAGRAVLSASFPFADHGKAMVLGETHGFVNLLCQPGSGELIGAQIIGPNAGDLIHELIAVMYYRGTAQDLLDMPHYHPTLAEIVTYPAEAIVARLRST